MSESAIWAALMAAPLSELVADVNRIHDAIGLRAPRLEEVTVTDDGETHDALRCPTCHNLADEDTLRAVDVSDRWSPLSDLSTDQHVATFSTGDDDYGRTFYYLHDDGKDWHPVNLPDTWREEWS